MSASPNEWHRRLMEGWPLLDIGTPRNRLPDGHPDRELWVRIAIEADDQDADFAEAAHLLIAWALGRKRLVAARRAAFQGDAWREEDRYLVRRVALAVCRNLAPDTGHSPALVDRIAAALLAPQPGAAVREERERNERRRRLVILRDAPPANRLPC